MNSNAQIYSFMTRNFIYTVTTEQFNTNFQSNQFNFNSSIKFTTKTKISLQFISQKRSTKKNKLFTTNQFTIKKKCILYSIATYVFYQNLHRHIKAFLIPIFSPHSNMIWLHPKIILVHQYQML